MFIRPKIHSNRILSALLLGSCTRTCATYSTSTHLNLRASDNHPLLQSRRAMLQTDVVHDIKGIIFDMDGTLTEPHAIDFKAMYSRNGLVKTPGEDILSLIAKLSEAERERAMQVLYEEEMLGCDRMQIRPNMHKFLEAAKRANIAIALATRNCDMAYQRFLQLAELPDDHFFPALHRDSLNGVNKPDPLIVSHILQHWEISPEDAHKVWFVGDSLDDVMCGKLAGCKTCLITTGDNNHVVLQNPTLVDVVIDDLSELSAYLKLHHDDN